MLSVTAAAAKMRLRQQVTVVKRLSELYGSAGRMPLRASRSLTYA